MKTFIRFYREFSLAVTLCFLFAAHAYSQTTLDAYLKEGLQNNIVMQQKNIVLEKALYMLKEANALFLPSVNINSSYITDYGGRYINFPLGTLLNPVYQSLNTMTKSSSFPQVSNQEIFFNPHNFYDAHARTSMPIINTDLYFNRQIQRDQIRLQEFEVDIYKRELIKNIKQAYYNYLMSLSSINVFENSLGLVTKNVQVNESLEANGKGLPSSVLRSQSELEKIKAELINSKAQASNAKQYFNFLLNKPLDSPIETAFDKDAALGEINNYLDKTSVENREELKITKTGVHLTGTQLKMSQTFWTPKLNAFLDLGSQGLNWEYSSRSRYYMLGTQLDIPVFAGFRNHYRISRTKLDLKSAELNEKQVAQQLQLNADVAQNNLTSSYQSYQAAIKEQKSAQSYFHFIESGYKEGTNTLIEYIDAQNQFTVSSLKLTIVTYKVLQAMAGIERETATYSFNN